LTVLDLVPKSIIVGNKVKRFAAIDIGSNAIRLLVSQVSEYEKGVLFKKLSLVRVPIRLGEDVFETGEISKDKIQKLIDAITGYNYLLSAYDVLDVRACATSAMREAENGKEVIDLIKKETGITIEIISGEKEAAIIFDAGLSSLVDLEKTYLYIDVGGGSTEITLFSEGNVLNSKSFKIGTVRLLKNKVEEEEWQCLKQWLIENLKKHKIEYAIGSGGNINKLIKLVPDNKKKDMFINYDELEILHRDLAGLSVEERMEKYALKSDRADVISIATNIFLTIMNCSKIDKVLVPKFGLADGLVRNLYKDSLLDE